MTKNLKDLWIFSDIDGTIVEAPNPIPPRNLEALRRFTERGGHFAVATGRSVDSALQYVKLLPINVPCIIFNGGVIYDFARRKLHYAQYLAETWRGYVSQIHRAFPHAGITALNDRYYVSVANRGPVDRYLVKVDGVSPADARMDDVREPLIKAIVVVDEADVPPVLAFMEAQHWPDVDLVRSSPQFIELLPRDVNKGSGLREYSRLFGLPMENIIAIGDYYNDETMLRTAGFPVAVAGAPEEIKRLCHHVTGNCMDGALADLVEYLEGICQ